MLTPKSMHSENKKFPTKDSRNNNFLVSQSMGASSAGLRHHDAMATPAMPKRIHPSKKIGTAATNGLHRAT
jgi:hypothetical protein